ncbi:hypothetical protein L211DRAFT_886109 [Terfezia boudieri ATCC MYA-4762]|uniref:Cytochrome P450 n=1 Tax=Terfezia boudieri ATCC MYA-4762 TaxID=1051890 RepID=A0A3N4LJU3_9PEZI|nr:hypothetical protein L211DRAFT_886109 [Terfezia boudieri ATCC MYA-4762]
MGAWLVKFISEGYQGLMVKLFQTALEMLTPQLYGAVIGLDYKLQKLYYMDNWPFVPSNLVITNPEIAQQVTVLASYDKHPELMKFIKPFSGDNNLVSSNGETWKK